MAWLLEAQGLVKHLGGRRVVDGVDLRCDAGQIVGLLGPNGAGKTTTLRILYGFLPSRGGTHPRRRRRARLRPGPGQAFDRRVHAGRHVRRRLHRRAQSDHRGQVLSGVLLAILVPLDLRLLRRRVLGD